jgi:type IV fimbrial biogenesis protein FimT
MLNSRINQFAGGFSLVELMVTIVVLAIAIAIAVPNFSTMIQNTRIRTAAESVQNGIQIARAEAVKRNAMIRFELAANSRWEVKCVTVVGDLDGDGEDDCPAVIQERTAGEGSASSIVVTADPAAATELVFNGLGRLTSLAGGVAPPNLVNINVDIDPTILPPEQSRNLRILVGIGGNTRMCDPDSTIPGTDPRAC